MPAGHSLSASLTHWLSQAVSQQYVSCEQTVAAHDEQLVESVEPAVHSSCVQLFPEPPPDPPPAPPPEPPPHVWPQIDWTSPAQVESHAVSQQ